MNISKMREYAFKLVYELEIQKEFSEESIDIFIANNDIDFTVGDGEIAILLGPNGAGKSTLIKCITGLLRFEGVIEIDGHSNKSIEAKKLLGYIPEMPAVYDMLTVAEHIEFVMRAYKCDERAYAESLLERFEMTDKKKKKKNSLVK